MVSFEADLRRFGEMLRAEQDHRIHDRGQAPDERKVEALRQSLVRRAGRMQTIVDRVTSAKYIRAPNGGIMGSQWDAALVGVMMCSQAYAAQQLADRVSMAVGRVEADPTLLAPPAPKPPSIDMPQTQTIIVHGGTVNVGQASSGGVNQTANAAPNVDGLKELVAAFREAVEALGASQEERQEFLALAAKLEKEIAKPKPLVASLLPVWTFMTTVATIEGTWQGWDRVQRIAADIATQLGPLIQNPPPPGTLA